MTAELLSKIPKSQMNSTDTIGRQISLKRRQKMSYFLGSIALFTVVLLWTFSSYLTSSVLEDYDQPFVITVVSSLSFLSYFIFLVIPDPMKKFINQRELDSQQTGDLEGHAVSGDDAKKPVAPLAPLTLFETSRVAFVFFILYFMSNCFMNLSLVNGDLASVSNLASTSVFFTLLLGYMAGVETLSTLRISAVLFSVIATLITVMPDFSFSSDATTAAIFALSSAFAYGMYSIYLKCVTKDESRVSMPILFAFVGLYTLIFVVPGLAFCHYFGLYVVQQPSRDACVNIAINAVIGGLIPNYMWNIAFALTTPLMVAIGLSFSTPLGVAAGYIKSGVVKTESAIAAFIIILSFCLLNLASLNEPLDAEIDEKVLKVLSSNSKASKNDS